MGSGIGRLRKHLDEDLIARIVNGIEIDPPALKRTKPPRAAETYRWYRRNQAIHGEIPGVWPGVKAKRGQPRITTGAKFPLDHYKPNGEREVARRRRQRERREAAV